MVTGAPPLTASVTVLLVVAAVTNRLTREPVASVNPAIVQVNAFGAAVLEALQIAGPLVPPVPFTPLPPPPITAHVLGATQPKRLDPMAAAVLKNRSPVLQVTGNTVPVFSGRVEIAALKSTFLVWVFRSIRLCAETTPIKASVPAISLLMFHHLPNSCYVSFHLCSS